MNLTNGNSGSCAGHDHSVAFKANLDIALIEKGIEKEEIFDTPPDPAEPFHSENALPFMAGRKPVFELEH